MKCVGVIGLVVFGSVMGLSPSAWSMCEVMGESTTFGLGAVLADPPCGPTGGGWMEMRTLLWGEHKPLNQIYTSSSGLTAFYTTTGNKSVKTAPGEIVGFMSASGASVTVAVFDDADGVCSSGQISGVIPLTNGRFEPFPVRAASGICVDVQGTTPAVTVIYK